MPSFANVDERVEFAFSTSEVWSWSNSGLWVTTGACGSAGWDAISAYVSPFPFFSFVVKAGPRVGGWSLLLLLLMVNFGLEDLA